MLTEMREKGKEDFETLTYTLGQGLLGTFGRGMPTKRAIWESQVMPM